MKWRPKHVSDSRTVTRFLWLPKTMYRGLKSGGPSKEKETRWLEIATWKQKWFQRDLNNKKKGCKWVDMLWLDNKET